MRGRKFKQDTLKFLTTLPTELLLALFVGTIPILWFSHSPETLREMVSGLLAIEQLIHYYSCAAIIYLMATVIKYYTRFRSDENTRRINYTYAIVSEVGLGIQSILRAGGGVALGIISSPQDITFTTTLTNLTLLQIAASALLVSGAISMSRNEATKRFKRETYDNPLKMDIRYPKITSL